MDVPVQTAVDILQHFVGLLQTACDAGQKTYELVSLTDGGGTLTKTTIPMPCELATDFRDHVDMVKSGKLRFDQ